MSTITAKKAFPVLHSFLQDVPERRQHLQHEFTLRAVPPTGTSRQILRSNRMSTFG